MTHLVFAGLGLFLLCLMVWVMSKTATDADQGIGWIIILALSCMVLFDGYFGLKWLLS